jgi:penicillin-binding protein 1A
MQLARNVFPKVLPGQERTMRRKLLEIRVAKAIEHRYTKSEILELYLNHIYFGGGAYGIETAARHYFGKHAKNLLLSESAALAALPKAPASYDPRRHPDRNEDRRKIVLSLMQSQGFITGREADLAARAKLKVPREAPRDRSGTQLGAYYIDVIRSMLDERFGDDLYSSRLRIRTSLDITAETAAEEELDRQLRNMRGSVRKGNGGLQGAVVMMDAKNGDVLALVGGRDHKESRYNRAILAQRQVGSAFKPFVYATAIQNGIPASQIISDEPLRIEISRGNVWEPKNYDGDYAGDITMREALVHSRNIPTVVLASQVGYSKIEDLAHKAGIRSDIPDQPSMALGVASITPIELATTYTSFATLGTRAQPRFIISVEDRNGKTLWEPKVETHADAMDPKTAYIVTDMLRDVVNRGTGYGVREAGFQGVAAGKTGTTNDATDAWFIGYTPEVVADVWIGYDTPSPLGSAATGGLIAAPVWGRIMRRYYARRELPREWAVPDGVVSREIDPSTGTVLEDGCSPEYGEPRREVFLADHVPEAGCPSQNWFDNLIDNFGDRLRGILGRPVTPVRPDTIDQNGGGGQENDARKARREAQRLEDAAQRRQDEMEKFLKERSKQIEKAARAAAKGRKGGG